MKIKFQRKEINMGKISKSKIIICIVALVIVVAIVVTVIMVRGNKDNEENVEKNFSDIYNEANLKIEDETNRQEENDLPVAEDPNPTGVE